MHLRPWPNMVSLIIKQMSQLNSYTKMVPETYRHICIWDNDQIWLAQSWNRCHSWICTEKWFQKHMHLKQLPNIVSQMINFFHIWTNYQIWWAHWTPSAFEYSTPWAHWTPSGVQYWTAVSSSNTPRSSIFKSGEFNGHLLEYNIQIQ